MANISFASSKRRSTEVIGPSYPRLLVTGASGQVGGELLRALAPLGTVVAPPRDELDLTNPVSIRACIRAVRPRWIVNAAAYTAVDRAESEPDLAFTINAEAVRVIGEEAGAHDAAVIHFSTDYVFDGEGIHPYTETDSTGPLGVYGASKLAGELALQAANPASLIFRTSWVYGANGKNFLRTILQLARERDHLRIVGDQHGAPTWSRDLARMTAHVIATCEDSADANPDSQTLRSKVADRAGVYHAAGSGETTWAGFAQEAILQTKYVHPSAELATVTPIPTSEYPTPARRPGNSRLSCKKLDRVFGWKMMPWQDSLSHVLSAIE